MHIRTLAGLLLVSSSFAVAQAPATRPAAAAEESEEVRLHAGGRDEYKAVFELPGISDQQRAALDEKIEERNQTLKAWVESEKGRRLVAMREELAAARRNKDQAKVGPLREQIEPLAKEYFDVRNRGRVGILQVLTPDQLAEYAARAIRIRATRGLEQIQFTSEQNEQIRAICVEAARQHLAAHPIERDPFFNQSEAVAADVRVKVANLITPEQREAARAAAATRPTTRPQATPNP